MTNIELADIAMQHAMTKGCTAARVVLFEGEENELEMRNDKLDRLHRSSGCQLSVMLYVDGKYSSVSTNRLQLDELRTFVERGIENTRLLAPDPFRVLPDKALLYGGEMDNMGLYDDKLSEVNVDTKIELAAKTINEIKSERLISASAVVNDSITHCYVATSDGFHGISSRSSIDLAAMVSLRGEGDERPEDYCYSTATSCQRLITEGIGAEALRRTVAKIGAERIESGTYDVVVDRWCGSTLFSPLMSALNGIALHQHASFLLNRKGEKIASEVLTINDNPLQQGRIGAALYDREGVALHSLNVVEHGVLKNYYISRYMGLKMDVQPTRAASSIIDFNLGADTTQGMIKNITKGVYITGFNGGNCNETTGDFSYGIEGYLVENGLIVKPISEMLMTGNMLKLWQNLVAVSCDPLNYSSWNIPSMLFSGVVLN